LPLPLEKLWLLNPELEWLPLKLELRPDENELCEEKL
jgi:hypothetical protein